MTDHGPGMTWLAERAGRSPEALVRDPGALLSSIGAAGMDAARLAARLGSEDPAVRAAAEAEARAVRARFAAAPGSPTPGERFAARVTAALRAEAERQRAAGTSAAHEASRSPGEPER